MPEQQFSFEIVDDDVVRDRIVLVMEQMFPHGAGQANHLRVRHALEQVAKTAYQRGQADGMNGIMTTEDVALHFKISPRRARALLKNRHERFGIGRMIHGSIVIHRSELAHIAPDEKYRKD